MENTLLIPEGNLNFKHQAPIQDIKYNVKHFSVKLKVKLLPIVICNFMVSYCEK